MFCLLWSREAIKLFKLANCCSWVGVQSLPLLDEGEFISEVDCGELDGFLWAVLKKRTSHSRKRMRMTCKYLKPIQHYTCPKCQNLKLLHVLCGHCLKETLKNTAATRWEGRGKNVNKKAGEKDLFYVVSNAILCFNMQKYFLCKRG